MDINDGIHDNLEVVICDDSALMRNLISRMVDETPGMNVIAKATNGQNLLNVLETNNPDIIILDIEMPVMTGVEFLRERKNKKLKIPVIILSSIAKQGAAVTMECLELGASDFITKPGGSISMNIADVTEELVEKIVSYGGIYARRKGKLIPFAGHILNLIEPKIKETATHTTSKQANEKTSSVQTKTNERSAPPLQTFNSKNGPAVITPLREHGVIKIIAIGISTGGPNALRDVFKMIDPHLTQPILVVQHMPAGFTTEFARSLDKICPLKVMEAMDNMPVENGHIYIAPGGYHITVELKYGGPIIHTNQNPHRNGHRPSADVLFESVAKEYKNNALGVIMTGMGGDGAAQLAELRRQGSWTLGQDEESSVVYGMPKVAMEMGGVQKQVSLMQMADEISMLAREHK